MHKFSVSKYVNCAHNSKMVGSMKTDRRNKTNFRFLAKEKHDGVFSQCVFYCEWKLHFALWPPSATVQNFQRDTQKNHRIIHRTAFDSGLLLDWGAVINSKHTVNNWPKYSTDNDFNESSRSDDNFIRWSRQVSSTFIDNCNILSIFCHVKNWALKFSSHLDSLRGSHHAAMAIFKPTEH